jgi:non-ribosomal peptide synthetase component F
MFAPEQNWREPGFAALESCQTLTACFEQVALSYAARPALVSDSWQPTYDEFNATANRVAHALMARGGKPGDRVAILMNHDAAVVGAAHAALKAARIGVVLNVSEPVERLRGLVADAEPTALVTDSTHIGVARALGRRDCAIVDFADAAKHERSLNPGLDARADDIAFLVYTSGSTGRPRGVMLTHRFVMRNVRKLCRALDTSARDRIALVLSLSSAVGVSTAYIALLNGACLLPFAAMDRGVAGLSEWLTAREVNVFTSTPSLFRHFMRTLDEARQYPHVRMVKLTAEPASAEDFRAFQQHFTDECMFLHNFGSSETGSIAYLLLARNDSVPEARHSMSWMDDTCRSFIRRCRPISHIAISAVRPMRLERPSVC